jgi:hypothetical protein
MSFKQKIYLYANSITQRCPKEIIKIFLVEDFFHLPLASMIDVLMITLLLLHYTKSSSTSRQRLYSEKEHCTKAWKPFSVGTLNNIHFFVLLAAMYTYTEQSLCRYTYGVQNVKYSIKKIFVRYTNLNPKQNNYSMFNCSFYFIY